MDSDITFSLLSYANSAEKKSLKTKPSVDKFSKLSSSKKQSKSTSRKENVESNQIIPARRCLTKNLGMPSSENSKNSSSPRILRERNTICDDTNFNNKKLSNQVLFKENTSNKIDSLQNTKTNVINPTLAPLDSLKFSTYQEIIDHSKKLFFKEKKIDEKKENFLSSSGTSNSSNDTNSSLDKKRPVLKGPNVVPILKGSQNYSNSSKENSSSSSGKSQTLQSSDEVKKNNSLSTSFSSLDRSLSAGHKSGCIHKIIAADITSTPSSPEVNNKSLYESFPSVFPEKMCQSKLPKLVSSTPRCSEVFNTSGNISVGFESAVSTLSKVNAHVSKCSINTSLTKGSTKVCYDNSFKNFESSKDKLSKESRSSSDRKFDALFSTESSGEKQNLELSDENKTARRYKKSDEQRVVFDTLKFRGITIRRHRREKVLGLQKDFVYDDTSSASSDEEPSDEGHCPVIEPEISAETILDDKQSVNSQIPKNSSLSDDSLSPIIRKLKSKPLLESSKSCSDNSTISDKPLFHSKEKIKSASLSASANMDESKSDSVLAAEKLLDELYGTAWHDKKESILPKSSIKKVKKKETPKNVICQSIRFSSCEEISPMKDTTRKKHLRKKKNSFIKDSSSDSDSNDINFYHSLTNRLQLSSIKPKVKSQMVILSSSSEDLMTSRRKSLRNKSSSSDFSENLNVSLKNKNRSDSTTARKDKTKSPSFVTKRNIKISSLNDKKYNTKSPGKKSPRTLLLKDRDVQVISSDSDENSVKTSKKTTLKKNVKPIINTPLKPDLKKFKVNTPKVSGKESRKLSFLASLSTNVEESKVHPDAVPYKKQYKAKKEELARRLLILFNKEIFESRLPDDMLIQWNARMRSTSGYCYNKKVRRTGIEMARVSRIVLSTKILDTPERLRDTLLHELCHSAAWIINGSADGHGPLWKSWANKAMKRFPEVPPIKRCHDYSIKTKFTYRCTSCGYSIGRHSKSLDITRKRCGYCYGAFELLVNHSKSNRKSAENLKAPRTPGKFALFVKENYNIVKQSNTQLKNSEIMKILGQQFTADKNQANKK